MIEMSVRLAPQLARVTVVTITDDDLLPTEVITDFEAYGFI